MDKHFTDNTFVARSPNVPTGLYMGYFACVNFFCNWRTIILKSTGPIFTTIHQMIGICVSVKDLDISF